MDYHHIVEEMGEGEVFGTGRVDGEKAPIQVGGGFHHLMGKR